MYDSKQDAGEDYVKGESEEEAFYTFFRLHPTVSYNDIQDEIDLNNDIHENGNALFVLTSEGKIYDINTGLRYDERTI